ncbi:putative transcription factor & lipid binding HD-SAD family [Lupinus albus]|uniref:Putative transcription factor & lipid binding HD-SAD family n=1 Tax=Lupinus albus TaxID=3870 RepID=A0A6A4PDA6_LUPAL|nr:putative transcription factor & lipid binding HD-SAD family [Lupinus albus]
MEYASSVGGKSGSYSPAGPDNHNHNGSNIQRRNRRYLRHTSEQIQRLESLFNECPHPDEKQRAQLSRELGLAPTQIKFWFQNRRTQMKVQHERKDNSTLRAENDKIRYENIAIKEALKNCICPNCGPPLLNEQNYFDDQKMRLENLHLKEELDRVSSIASKYIGRPISQLPSIPPIHISPLDLSMGSNFGTQGLLGVGARVGAGVGSSLNLDLLQGTTSNSMPMLPYQPGSISEMDKSLMSTISTNAFEEFLRLFDTNEPLWVKSIINGKEFLNLETYERMFPKENTRLKSPNVSVESSRDSAVVMMSSSRLAEMFVDANKWKELFATIVSTARTIEVISSGIMGGNNGSLQLMYEELQVLSPYVSTREFYFLRYSRQIDQGTWAIVDVSYDFPQNQFSMQLRSHRFPSGCLIQDLPNGQSKVTWIEHVEVEDKTPPHRFFKNIIYSGLAFGAERWLATLQRICERIACLMVTSNSTHDVGGVITSSEGKRSMMILSQKMVTNFCANVGTSNGQKWTTVSGLDEVVFRVTVHKSTNPGQSNGAVLSAATTIRLPIPPNIVFSFFKDGRNRPKVVTYSRYWDVLANGVPMQEVAHIPCGSHPSNCISILQVRISLYNVPVELL